MGASVESLLRELANVGEPVQSLSDLVNTRRAYPAAVPVLLRWLDTLDARDLTKPSREVDMAVRALTVPAARGKAARKLIELFKVVGDPSGTGTRWSIGNALGIVAEEAVSDDLIALAKEQSYGPARQMVVLGLGRFATERVELALIGLLEDDEVAGYAAMALGRIRSQRAVPTISRLLDHPKPWVRKEANKALVKIQSQSSASH